MKPYGLDLFSQSLQRVASLSPLPLQNGEHDLVGPLTFDKFVFHEMGLLVKTGLFQRAYGCSIATIASPDDTMKVVLIEGEFEQRVVDLGGVPEAVMLRVQRPTYLALAMFIIVPAQHEVSNEAPGLAQLDGYEHSIVDVSVLGRADALFERLFGLRAGAGHAVEVSIDGLVFEDLREVIEVAPLEASNDESLRTDRARELGHQYFLLPGTRR
jgi:hypothetical protein